MIIVGAGLAGLLCGALNPGSTIFESKPKEEINHKALFRLRSDEISKLTGIPFKKVNVSKGIWFEGKEELVSPRMSNLYSQKVSGKITDRSISNLDTCIRYISPEDFLQRLKDKNTDICYNIDYFDNTIDFKIDVVSTIPMPILAYKLGVNNEYFNNDCSGKRIFINQFRIKNCDSYSTIYYPESALSIYRASLNGDILIIESLSELCEIELIIVQESLGICRKLWDKNNIVKNHIQPLGKINEIDNKFRSDFITKMTIEKNIYSLGRFATWRPGILLDDILQDIFVIRRLIEGGNYAANLHKQNKD